MLVRMDERQKLRDDLARYQTIRGLTTDEQAIRALEELSGALENRLAEMDQKSESGHRADVSG
jgi:hypothetical protein